MTTPSFLYRALPEEAYARRFVHDGVVWLSNIHRYRTIVDAKRHDPDEGTARYLEPMEGRPGTGSDDLIMNTRRIFNPVLVLCVSEPSIEPEVLVTFGSHVIRINDPDALCRDLRNYFRSGPHETRGSVELCKVAYSESEPVDPSLDGRGRHRLTYAQKAIRYRAECEWRIVLIVETLHRVPGVIAKLGRRLEYCELLPNYCVNPSAGDRPPAG